MVCTLEEAGQYFNKKTLYFVLNPSESGIKANIVVTLRHIVCVQSAFITA